jgi:hypothetical protein
VNTFSFPKEKLHWLKEDRNGYVEEVMRWFRAYEPLFNIFQTPPQKKSLGFIGSTILKMHAIVTRIMLAGAFFSTEIGYDELLPEFKEVFHLAESIYEPLIMSIKDKVS